MRVLAIANHVGSRGGLERTQLTNCRALADRGHEVDLVYVTPGDFTADWQSFAHSMTRIDGSLPRSRAPVSSTLAMVRAVRAARALAPDVVYVYRYLDVPLAAAVGRATGAPVVLHLCLPQPGDLPLLVRRSLSAVGTTISVSRDTAEGWRGTRLPSAGVVVVQTGIDMDHYVPAGEAARMATRHALGLEADDFVVLYAGRIGPLKGVHVLVEAFRDLAEKLESARMVIVGGPSLSAAPDQAARYVAGLRARSDPDRVVWLEPRRDVLPLIQMADVAAAPSVWPEPFSRSVIEPLACGVPAVATRVGGNPEILTGWLADYLVPPDDPGSLAERIIALEGWRRSDPGLGDRFRHAVVDRLSLGREVDAIEDCLTAAARSRSS